MDNIEKGMYRHYKGNIYNVLHIGLHTETMEKMVVYQDASDSSKIWVRPASMWNEIADVDGEQKLRFEKISD